MWYALFQRKCLLAGASPETRITHLMCIFMSVVWPTENSIENGRKCFVLDWGHISGSRNISGIRSVFVGVLRFWERPPIFQIDGYIAGKETIIFLIGIVKTRNSYCGACAANKTAIATCDRAFVPKLMDHFVFALHERHILYSRRCLTIEYIFIQGEIRGDGGITEFNLNGIHQFW